MNKHDFSNEDHYYYEWVFDTFTDATRLVWELGGYDLQSGKDLDTQWKAIQPILKDAFEKAENWDKIQIKQPSEAIIAFMKLEHIKSLVKKNKVDHTIEPIIDEFGDGIQYIIKKLEKILGNSQFKENDE